MSHLRISIALCTYNGEAYLSEQLLSLLDQTLLPDEVLLGDDGSTDGTCAMLELFANKARERGVVVRLIRRPVNLGFVANFSDTLRRATGDIVFLCDQDDVWRPEKLAAMESRFSSEPNLLLLASDARLVNAQGGDMGLTACDAIGLTFEERGRVHDGRAFEVLLRRSMIVGATVALRRSALKYALPVGSGWIHDEWLAVVLSSVGRIDFVERALVDYRQHGANQVGLRDRRLTDQWHDMVMTRREQLLSELARIDSLESGLLRLGTMVPQEHLEDIQRKRIHLKARIALGKRSRVLRPVGIFEEMCSGNYHRFGTGIITAIRDILRRG